MTTKKPLIFLVALFIFSSTNLFAQEGPTSHIGVFAGPVAFQSDFGQRDDYETNSENVGIGFGLTYHADWAYSTPSNPETFGEYIKSHFMLRGELMYHTTTLNHYGRWAEGDGLLGRKLRAMEGKANVFELGPHFEWHPRNIRDYQNQGHNFDYYLGGGINYVNYSPEVTSSLGDVSDRDVIPGSFVNGIDTSSDDTFSLVFQGGVRYNVSKSSNIGITSRWHYYDSNFVDGLSPQGDQNKANDWIWMVHLSYIYTFGNDSGATNAGFNNN